MSTGDTICRPGMAPSGRSGIWARQQLPSQSSVNLRRASLWIDIHLIMKIIIIGAGLSGLALSLGLNRHQIPDTVYESDAGQITAIKVIGSA